MRNVIRIATVLVLGSLLAGCFPHGRHPYTSSGPSDQNSQAYWTDFSSAREQKQLWSEQVDRERRARLHNYFN